MIKFLVLKIQQPVSWTHFDYHCKYGYSRSAPKSSWLLYMQFSYRAFSLALLSICDSHTLSASRDGASTTLHLAHRFLWVNSTHHLLPLHPVIIFRIISICILEISIKTLPSIVWFCGSVDIKLLSCCWSWSWTLPNAGMEEPGAPGHFLTPKDPSTIAVPVSSPALQKRQKSRNWNPNICSVWNYIYRSFGCVCMNQTCLNYLPDVVASKNLIRVE